MEQKHNKQLRAEEYSIEYSAHEQAADLWSNLWNILGIFKKSLPKSAAAHGQNIQWDILMYAAVCCVFVPFLKENSANILMVRPHP